MKEIHSHENALVKTLRRLSRSRKRQPDFLIEGRRLVHEALEAGLSLRSIVLSSALPDSPFEDRAARVPQVRLETSLFRSVSSLDSPDGVLAVAARPRRATVPATGVIAVADGVQDPRNLGAIVRVCEAAGADGLAVVKGTVDPFSPKVVRGAMGSVFRVPVLELDALSQLDGFRFVALVPSGGVDFRSFDWSPPVAIVFGSEGAGLSATKLEPSTPAVTIPMRGRVESLNVATAAALVLYEAQRSRG